MVGPTTNQRLERQRLAAEHQIRQLRRLRELDPAALGWCMEVEVPYPIALVDEFVIFHEDDLPRQ